MRNRHDRRPIFAFAAASLVLAALIQADTAGAQNTSNSGGSSISQNDKSGIKVGSMMFVATDKLNLRKQASLGSDAVVGSLKLNDQVQIVDAMDSSTPLVKIKIIKSSSADNSLSAELYVSGDYLSAQMSAGSSESGELSKYIIIQNIATERTRVYERCTGTPGCAHRMIMETEMVVGQPTGGDETATWAGRYKISQWVKFYQDGNASYPSWYDPNSPELPKPGSSMGSWISKKLLPDGKGHVRGAFGWYAAMVAPNANYQWIHGTMGWGSDGDAFIQAPKKGIVSIFKDLRSHGCTRVENRASAFLRHFMTPGTEVLRVYAIEGYRDASLKNYPVAGQTKPWEFILTKDGVRQSNGPTADRAAVLASGVSSDRILEQGTYQVDQTPSAVKLVEDASKGQRRKGKSGNTYGIDDDSFRGTFLIDEGRFVDYQHPAGIEVGGFENRLPDYFKTSGSFTKP